MDDMKKVYNPLYLVVNYAPHPHFPYARSDIPCAGYRSRL